MTIRDMMATVKVNPKLIEFLVNETSLLSKRIASFQSHGLDGPRRSINDECQYPADISAEQYREMYDREGYGGKVVDSLANECWCVDPDVRENQSTSSTALERAWDDFIESPASPLLALQLLDKRQGVGRFGAAVIYLDDEMDLEKPASGIDDRGRAADGTPQARQVLKFEVFDETEIRIAEVEGGKNHPRFRQPTMYEVLRPDLQTFGNASTPMPTADPVWEKIHWTRVIHSADDELPGTVLARPRQKRVWNRLLDIRKILGGDGEMFWKGGFPGLAISTDPRLMEAGATVELDEDSLKEQLRLYMDGLQRYLTLVGMQANSLSPQIADPSAHALVHLQAIACALDYPLRIFLGAEEAKVASGHEMQNWRRRISRRQNGYLTKCMLRPFIERMILLGVLPKARKTDKWGRPSLIIKWPPISSPTEDERSTTADRLADCMLKYTQARGWELMQPTDFLRFVMQFDPDIVAEIMANNKEKRQISFTDPSPPPGGDTGVAGKPNSDPKPAGVK